MKEITNTQNLKIAVVNTANTNLVHESEAQRQHARVNLPVKLKYKLANGQVQQFHIHDISAGGFSLDAPELYLNTGGQHEASLQFQIDSLEFLLNVSFLIKYSDEYGRYGCEFQNMGAHDIATLRFMITSHLSGELVTMGDMINTLSRQNFTKSRSRNSVVVKMSWFARIRALSMSLIVLLAGLGALIFISSKLYSAYFITHAESAVIKVTTFNVSMPRDGKFRSLIPDDGVIKLGVPIASFETVMLDALKGHLDEANLSSNMIATLFNQTLAGTISSPCDCTLQKQLIEDGQFASKGTPAFQLTPINAEPFVEAKFSFENSATDVMPGKLVDIEIPGKSQTIVGIVGNVTMSTGGDSLLATIKPQESIPADLTGRPVSVVLEDTAEGPFATFFWKTVTRLSQLIDNAINSIFAPKSSVSDLSGES